MDREGKMNDTHGEQDEGWYGFDLDGTLAKYDGWKGIGNIGEPIKPMVDLIKSMHDEGKVVKIMTARVSPRENPEELDNPYDKRPEYAPRPGPVDADRGVLFSFYDRNKWRADDFIADWCQHYLGFIPEIVYQKDHLMLELYDDRVKQVVPNEGWLVEDIAASKRQRVVIDRLEIVNAKWWDRLNWFFVGALLTCAVLAIASTVTDRTKPLPEATEKLHEAIHEFMDSQRQEAR